ncbi:hypothetical protein [Streptomyces sp. NPDC006270]|uniref:hypothetical protein n=1 Tax=Streptomyces sp. NPDC006270 TaxID=3364741 RepID=UPI0036858025
MAPLLDSLGQKLAEKWISALAAPGLLFVAAVASAALLGQGDALDRSVWMERAGRWAAEVGRWPTVGQIAAVAAVVLASVAAGTSVRACTREAERIWTGDWPAAARSTAGRLTARRLGRWEQINERIDTLRTATPAHARGAEQRRLIDELTTRRDAIARAEPCRPTLTGDHFVAAGTRLSNQYGVDLAACWPRLWLVLPDDVRTELRSSRARFDVALAGSVWACCYAMLGCFWWPAAVGAVGVGLVAWRRGRLAGAAHAELVEATVDVHLSRLAHELGLDVSGPPGIELGAALNRIARKGA